MLVKFDVRLFVSSSVENKKLKNVAKLAKRIIPWIVGGVQAWKLLYVLAFIPLFGATELKITSRRCSMYAR